MKYKHPKYETVIAFLQARGWTVAKKDKAAVYLDPPGYLTFGQPFQYEVPSNTKLKEYIRFLTYTIHSIAGMYDIKYEALYDLFCYDYKDVKNAVEPQEALVAAA